MLLLLMVCIFVVVSFSQFVRTFSELFLQAINDYEKF